MMNLNLLTAVFTSVLGEVKAEDIEKSLKLMGFGMLGIFIVMILIFLAIIGLNRATGKKKGE